MDCMYSPWGRKEQDRAEQLSLHFHFPPFLGLTLQFPCFETQNTYLQYGWDRIF